MPSEARARHITQQACPESRKNQLPQRQFWQFIQGLALDFLLPLTLRLRPCCSSDIAEWSPGWP